ncbi:hypothetical protein [Streptomyces sp. ST2-7A]|uniref:hypothetical protein n=1 Tax=Streptomyces sp. ST2-7A TaxID=2907214 RepID=UPI001F306621|nr:hypothetical protein [Streptomyces sp. ST2-7A]MCE7078959.1 hypothetical protein [Streptomyces sp. ST2-7A]
MPDDRDIASGINQLEGYLLVQSELRTARVEGEALADRMPWLTGERREELIRLYAEERMALTRRTLRAVTERCHELRAEYTTRYRQLRRRVVCAALAVVLGGLTLSACPAGHRGTVDSRGSGSARTGSVTVCAPEACVAPETTAPTS